MNSTVNNELNKAKEILKILRDKKIKTYKEYEDIIDLNYFISSYENNKSVTEQMELSLTKTKSGYYEKYIKTLDKKDNGIKLKLNNDNIQYSFF